jgi:hypothetical protein
MCKSSLDYFQRIRSLQENTTFGPIQTKDTEPDKLEGKVSEA